MEERKKKKVYIGIIATCMGVTAVVLFLMLKPSGVAPHSNSPGGVTSDQTIPATRPNNATAARAPGDVSATSFVTPAVFPVSKTFNTAILEDNSTIRSLNDYAPLSVTPEEQARDNPFSDY